MKQTTRINLSDPLLIAPNYDLRMFFRPEIADIKGEALEAIRSGSEESELGLLEIQGRTAVISIDGPMRPGRAYSGTSYDDIQAAVALIRERQTIERAILKIDSPGGTVKGAFETEKALYDLAKEKELIAVTVGSMTSGAMLLAFPAKKRYITSETNTVGSIGVVTAHTDASGFYKEFWGVVMTSVAKGEYKDAGTELREYDAKAREVFEYYTQKYYDVFVNSAVRGLKLTREQVLAQESRVYIGSDAIEVGLVDGIIDYASLFSTPDNPVFINHDQGLGMDITKLRADFPAECTEMESAAFQRGVDSVNIEEKVAAARIEAVKTERDRQHLFATEFKGCGFDSLVAEMLNEGVSYEAAAVRIIQAQNEQRARMSATLVEGIPGAINTDTPPAVQADDADKKRLENATPEEKLKSEWDGDADLREEFSGDFDAFSAYAKAEANGQARVFSKTANKRG